MGARDVKGGDELPTALPHIRLYRSQAIWVLTELGFRGAASEDTFKEYIKSLRKLGTPFVRGEVKPRGRLANYSFCHLMELAVVLTLRVYHVVPDSVLAELVRHRKLLCGFYRRAYSERGTGKGSPITIEAADHTPIRLQGLFLDLQMNFSGAQLTSFGPPKLLSPFQAVEIFAKSDIAARSFLPLRLSTLAERVVTAALRAPPVRKAKIPLKIARLRQSTRGGTL